MKTEEKTALDHVNDFFDGIYDTAVGAPVAFGDFLARISGYRDYQFTSGSVLDLDSSLEQKQALNEMKILYEALTHQETLNLIKDAILEDFENRSAYYLGGFGTTTAIGSTFTNIGVKYAYKGLVTGSKVKQAVHELYETTEDFLNTSDEEFMNFVNDNMADTSWIDTSNDSYINMAKELGVQNVTIDTQTYTIKSGDTLYSIAQSSNVTVDELLQANPWLEEQGRVNEDKSYVLIKTGETINISKDNNTYSYDIENSSVSIKDASNNPIALESISNDMLMNISDGYTTLNTQTKTLDLNTMTTIDGGYGAIVNVKDTSGNDIFIVPDEYGNVSVYDNNGQLDMFQSSAVLNTLNSNSLDTNWSDIQQNIFRLNDMSIIGDDLYMNLNTNISQQLINNLGLSNPFVDSYFDSLIPTDIGAFYESTTQREDNSTTIADKTFVLLDSSNNSISSEQLEALDVNADGKLDETEITTLKTWKDINEDGIFEKVSFIKSKYVIRFYQANFKKVA